MKRGTAFGYSSAANSLPERQPLLIGGRRGGGLITPNGDWIRRRAALKLLTADDVAAISGLSVDTVYAVFGSKRVNVRSVWGVVQAIENADTPDPRFRAALFSDG